LKRDYKVIVKRRYDMTKKIEIVEIISEGRNMFFAEMNVWCESVEEFIESKKVEEIEEEGEWFVSELKDGWILYGYEGSEYEGFVKVVESEEEKNNLLNMNSDELCEIIYEITE